MTTIDGKVRLTFSQSQALAYGVELLGSGGESVGVGEHVMVRCGGGRLTVDVRLPKDGQYALKLHAIDPRTTGSMKNVVNYLIRYNSQSPIGGVAPFQRVEGGVLGPNTYMCTQLGIKALSHTGDVIETAGGQATVTFDLKKRPKHGALLGVDPSRP